MTQAENIFELNGLSKHFPGVVALNGVDLQLRRGEVHVLLGENGAGKSSLVKLLAGIYQPDAGTMLYNGLPYQPKSPAEALHAGVRVVHQELNLLTYLSVAENIFFGKLPRRFGLVDYRKLYRDTRRRLDEVGLAIAPSTPVERLGIAQMQLIEIAKALSSESRVLIMDEPTATLTPRETGRLFEILRRLKERQVTILYISHHLQEIFEIGDTVTVLRNGRKIATQPIGELTIAQIVKMMVGRELESEYPFHENITPGEEALRVSDLRCKGSTASVSFTARRGELLGIAGLIGSGRTETMRAIFGADPKAAGRIFVKGREVFISSPHSAVANGIGLLTEDRKEQGLILDMECYVNVTLTNLHQVSRLGLLEPKAERAITERYVRDLAIKTPSVNQKVRNLSGGNQQKVVIAKWLFRHTDIIIFDEPTRGIDVGAKYEIYLLLWQLAADGKTIIIVSSDLPELMGLCHRILVFSKGRITGEVARADFNQEKILSLAYQEYLHSSSAVEAVQQGGK